MLNQRLSVSGLAAAAALAVLLAGCETNQRAAREPGEPTLGYPAEQLTPAEAVWRANDQLYLALNRMLAGDLAPMKAVWAQRDDVTLAGPFGGVFTGWEQVRQQLARQADLRLGGHVDPENVLVRVDDSGDMGYVFCIETGQNLGPDGRAILISHRATYIYHRFEDGQWRLVHRHTDIAPALVERVRPR